MRWFLMAALTACGGASVAPEAPRAVAEVAEMELGDADELFSHDDDPNADREPLGPVAVFDRGEVREPADPGAEILGDFGHHEGVYVVSRAGPDIADLGPLTIVGGIGACRARTLRALRVRIHYVYPDPNPPADDPSLIDRLADMAMFEQCEGAGAVGVLRNAPEVSWRAIDYENAVPVPPEIMALVVQPEPEPNGEPVTFEMISLRAPQTYVVTDGTFTTVVHRGHVLHTDYLAPYAEVTAGDRTFLLQGTVSSDDVAYEIGSD